MMDDLITIHVDIDIVVEISPHQLVPLTATLLDLFLRRKDLVAVRENVLLENLPVHGGVGTTAPRSEIGGADFWHERHGDLPAVAVLLPHRVEAVGVEGAIEGVRSNRERTRDECFEAIVCHGDASYLVVLRPNTFLLQPLAAVTEDVHQGCGRHLVWRPLDDPRDMRHRTSVRNAVCFSSEVARCLVRDEVANGEADCAIAVMDVTAQAVADASKKYGDVIRLVGTWDSDFRSLTYRGEQVYGWRAIPENTPGIQAFLDWDGDNGRATWSPEVVTQSAVVVYREGMSEDLVQILKDAVIQVARLKDDVQK